MSNLQNPDNSVAFWRKLNGFAYQAGRELVEKALWLYYAAARPETPTWARSVIIGALAYFVIPTDAIPDFIPGAGYADDLSVLATAVGTVLLFINDDVKRKSDAVLSRWFSKPELSKGSPHEADPEAANHP